MRFKIRNLRLHHAVVGLLLAVSAPASFCQEVLVTTRVDSTHITVGDWLNLSVEVKHPPGVNLIWSQLRDTLGHFEIVRLDTLPSGNADGTVTEGRKLTLSVYDSGSYTIPPILIGYKGASDTALRFVESDAHAVTVSTVQVDTSKAIKDIKPPLGVPLTWKEIATYTGIVLLIAALCYGLYYYYRKMKKKRGEIVEPPAPKIPPHIQAMMKLRELQEKRVWQQGDVKLFYSEATEIVRQYFEGRYGIMALELTSYEVFDQLKQFQLDSGTTKLIEGFFINADLVKFAKYAPVPSENEAVVPQALDIVERTKPKEVVQENV